MTARVSRRGPAAPLLALLGPVLGLLLAACGSGTGAASGITAPSSVTLRVGSTGWSTAQAALRVAGLDRTPYQVQWAVFPGGDKQLQALQAGALDLTETSDIPPVFAAAAARPAFQVVAVEQANTLQQEVVVGPGSPITSMAQLRGRRVGYVQNTTAHYFLDRLLQRAGLSWGDIVPVALSPNDGVTALTSGSIDALASYGNSIITVHELGGRLVGDGKDILSGNFPWQASDAAVADPGRRAAAIDLLARIHQAYAYIRAGHEEPFAAATAAATHEPLAMARRQLHDQEAQRPTAVVPTTPAAIAAEQAVADTFTQLKIIPGRVDVTSFWTTAWNADLSRALITPITPSAGR